MEKELTKIVKSYAGLPKIWCITESLLGEIEACLSKNSEDQIVVIDFSTKNDLYTGNFKMSKRTVLPEITGNEVLCIA